MQKQMADVIIVGGGPAGISAATILARAGKKVVVIERGNFAGSKNVFGGAIYAKPTAEIFPNFEEEAPLERCNTEHRYALLGEDDGTVISYKNPIHCQKGETNSYTVIRAKWDRWCAEQAKKEGAYIVTETIVREIIIKESKVVGIKTDLEEFYAPITIIADGVNSLLTKQLGLRKETQPKEVALGIKEVITLSKEKIQDRFNLDDKTGVIYTIAGGPMLGMLGLGYIYTNQESISIGVGVSLEELQKRNIKPYEILNELKEHPSIAPLIKDGDLKEYSAHLIPEGGYNSMPKILGNGFMVAGDAAMFVNNVHWEGTNLAMLSGKLAAETAIVALEQNDFSEHTLELYKKKLKHSFILKDLKTYRNVIPTLEHNASAFLGFYPKKINEFMEMFTSVDSIPKRQKYRTFIKNIFKERNLFKIALDMLKLLKLVWGVIVR
ncbi:MAG: FAD-dependent oxidoreductase [Candidatus Gastranaerophilales bacterium]|nr:FAD-dependent oxidoreductase [Candidatus Gastranaerophilales bacterium]